MHSSHLLQDPSLQLRFILSGLAVQNAAQPGLPVLPLVFLASGLRLLLVIGVRNDFFLHSFSFLRLRSFFCFIAFALALRSSVFSALTEQCPL
jgi:hypothetical protein